MVATLAAPLIWTTFFPVICQVEEHRVVSVSYKSVQVVLVLNPGNFCF